MRIQLSEHFTYSKLLRFTLPSIIMMIFTSIYGVVDGIFVSNFVGKIPFAAINLIMPLLMVLGALGFMIGTGGTAITAKTLGEGKPEQANQYFSLLVYAAVSCLALLLCADREAALLYIFLGWYPALRPRLCRLPRLPGAAVKCALFCAAVTAMYGLILYLFRMEAVAAEFAGYSAAMLAGLLAMGCVVFLLFDRALSVLTLLYRQKRR